MHKLSLSGPMYYIQSCVIRKCVIKGVYCTLAKSEDTDNPKLSSIGPCEQVPALATHDNDNCYLLSQRELSVE